MAIRKAKSAAKIFETDKNKLKKMVINTMKRISDAVGSSLGPGGKVTLIESDYPGIPDKITKDGVTIFKSLGANNPYEHVIIETARSVAERTVSEAGDGTTTSTILAYNLISNLFEFCEKNPKYSPQKAVRRINKVVKDNLIPYINSRSIKVTEDNKELLKMVARISANGDNDIANAVIEAFETIGYGSSSHVTIREMNGDTGYKVERIDGFPIEMGYEESAGKLHTAFINDTANQRVYLEKPLFLLFDGHINDIVNILPMINALGEKYVHEGKSEYKNMVIVAHGFSDSVLTTLAFNMADPNTINVVPLITPMRQFINSQTHFLYDLAAFTGSKVFGLRNQLSTATLADLGGNMESVELYRFRSTVVGDPDATLVEMRADDLRTMAKQAESQAEKLWLDERIGKITNGIAKLTVFGGSGGELKELKDRVEDAVCAVRSSITAGVLPGGCRIAIDLALKLAEELEEGDPARDVLMSSFMSLPIKLLENAGHNNEEIDGVLATLASDRNSVYDVENQEFGSAENLGLFDAAKAVTESLKNAVSIAGVLGTLGSIVCHPRDDVFERGEAREDSNFDRAVSNPNQYKNEADERF